MIQMQASIKVEADFTDLAIGRCSSGLHEIIAKGAYTAEAFMKQEIMSGEKSGRIYTRKSSVHQASAPGESPANDLGDLVNSISTEIGDKSAEITVDGGSAAYLEFGTHDIEPRPFAMPAAEEAEAGIERDLAALRLVD